MKSSTKIFAAAAVILSFLLLSPEWCCAQKRRKEKKGQETVSVKDVRAGIREAEDKPKDGNGFLPFFVEGGDTIYYDEITASKVYSRLPKQKGKEWRKYYRLVHNFSKSYPYALVAKKLVEREPDIGAILLECSDLPPYAKAIQAATGLPVFDFNTMIDMVFHAVVQKTYYGYF